MTIDITNRPALSALTIEVLLRARGVDNFIGKRNFSLQKEGTVKPLFDSEQIFFNVHICLYGLALCNQKPKGLCLQRTEYNKLHLMLSATSTPGATKKKRPLYLFILIKLASSYLYLDSLETLT